MERDRHCYQSYCFRVSALQFSNYTFFPDDWLGWSTQQHSSFSFFFFFLSALLRNRERESSGNVWKLLTKHSSRDYFLRANFEIPRALITSLNDVSSVRWIRRCNYDEKKKNKHGTRLYTFFPFFFFSLFLVFFFHARDCWYDSNEFMETINL